MKRPTGSGGDPSSSPAGPKKNDGDVENVPPRELRGVIGAPRCDFRMLGVRFAGHSRGLW